VIPSACISRSSAGLVEDEDASWLELALLPASSGGGGASVDELRASAAAATNAAKLGRARICSSSEGLAFCRNVSRSLLPTTPVPTTTIFELRLMLYGTPSGSIVSLVDTAFLGGIGLLSVSPD
jgi:hypothetical protein